MGTKRHIPRLFITDDLSDGAEIVATRDIVHRLFTVMRRKVGDLVILFNGRDGEWEAEIAAAARKSATLRVTRRLRPQAAPADIALAFAPLKAARLDYVAQKASELGVARIEPVITQFTDNTRINIDKLRANAIEGAEQCGVLWVPDISEPVPFADFAAAFQGGRTLVFCDEAAEIGDPHSALSGTAPPVTVIVGPEGGFSDEERSLLRGLPGARAISLGPRVMRADTAIVAALALVQTVAGDWR